MLIPASSVSTGVMAITELWFAKKMYATARTYVFGEVKGTRRHNEEESGNETRVEVK